MADIKGVADHANVDVKELIVPAITAPDMKVVPVASVPTVAEAKGKKLSVAEQVAILGQRVKGNEEMLALNQEMLVVSQQQHTLRLDKLVELFTQMKQVYDSQGIEIEKMAANRANDISNSEQQFSALKKQQDELKRRINHPAETYGESLKQRGDESVRERFTQREQQKSFMATSSRRTVTTGELADMFDEMDSEASSSSWAGLDAGRFGTSGTTGLNVTFGTAERDQQEETTSMSVTQLQQLNKGQGLVNTSYVAEDVNVVKLRLQEALLKSRAQAESIEREYREERTKAQRQEFEDRDRLHEYERQERERESQQQGQRWSSTSGVSPTRPRPTAGYGGGNNATMHTSNLDNSSKPTIRSMNRMQLEEYVKENFNKRQETKQYHASQAFKEKSKRDFLLGKSQNTFGIFGKSKLLQKQIDAARAKQMIERENERPGAVYIETNPVMKMKVELNIYSSMALLKKCIMWDAGLGHRKSCPGSFCRPELLKTIQNRIANLDKLPELRLDLGIYYLQVPTIQELQDMHKEEFYTYISMALVPHTKTEYEATWDSALLSQTLDHEFLMDEYPGPQDKDRLEMYDAERDEFVLGAEADILPQYSVTRCNEDGTPKECTNWSGMKPNEALLTKGMQAIYFSGPRFRDNPKGPNGKVDPNVKSFKQAVMEDMSQCFTQNKLIPRIGVNFVHDIHLAKLCKANYYSTRKDMFLYNNVLSPGDHTGVLMTHQAVTRHADHPGRLIAMPQQDGQRHPQVHLSQSQGQQDTSSIPSYSATKLEKEYRERMAQAHGEGKNPPFFWKRKLQDRDLVSKFPLNQRRSMIASMIAEERKEAERAPYESYPWQLSQSEDLDISVEDIYPQYEGLYFRNGMRSSENATRDAEEFQPSSAASRTFEPSHGDRAMTYNQDYYEDAKDAVMDMLAQCNAMQLQELPMSVRERVADYRDRNFSVTREEHRHDGTHWQDRRNSAGHNPGRLYEPPKTVTFAKKSACFKHLYNKCPYADNPSRCQWSHDEAVCQAEADVIATVARDRSKAMEKAREAQAKTSAKEKPAVVAAVGGDQAPQEEQDQFNGMFRYPRPLPEGTREE